MTLIVAILLGIIQGVTEFLPVSSSGHVLIASRLLDNPSSFEFDVLVSFGTLLAVMVYYRHRLISIISDLFRARDSRLIVRLFVSTIPAVVVGFLFQDFIELYLHGTTTAIAMLFSIGVLMIVSSRWPVRPSLEANKDIRRVSVFHAFLVGLAQVVSLISGSSRSGVTMLAALRLGFSPATAAEWSFLMSIPVIAGAALRVLVSESGREFVQANPTVFVVSNVVSFAAGMLAIHVLLRLLKRRGLYWFGWYRVVLAVVLFGLVSVNIL